MVDRCGCSRVLGCNVICDGVPILKHVEELLSLYRNRGRASKDVKRVALAHVADIDHKIAELTAIRNTVADPARRCHGDDRPQCPILEDLETKAQTGDRQNRPGGASRRSR